MIENKRAANKLNDTSIGVNGSVKSRRQTVEKAWTSEMARTVKFAKNLSANKKFDNDPYLLRHTNTSHSTVFAQPYAIYKERAPMNYVDMVETGQIIPK